MYLSSSSVLQHEFLKLFFKKNNKDLKREERKKNIGTKTFSAKPFCAIIIQYFSKIHLFGLKLQS